MNSAATDIAEKLATLNRIYFDKFGWIFIVCATGKSAEEMLRLLEARLANQPEDELRLAAAEQNQITLLRLRKLFHATRISTHVLNTSSGKPAGGVPVHLYQADRQIAAGATDADGRCQNLLASGQTLIPGVYRLVFDVAALFPDGLYPEVNISFSVNAEVAHYHLPLLISPFGYTTYRGS
jgi:hydroxyisourate hydrolase